MSTTDSESIKKEVRGYLVIFAGLISLSLAAVGLNYLKLPLAVAVTLTLIIASVQVFLAAGYFMHLISEKRIFIYIVLALTAIFAVGVLFLPIVTHQDPISGTTHSQKTVNNTEIAHTTDVH